jgi:hypothetical protein
MISVLYSNNMVYIILLDLEVLITNSMSLLAWFIQFFS